MRKYIAIFKSQIQITFAYSAWFWASMISAVFQLIILFYFWHAVYQNSDTIGNMNIKQMITYVMIATILGKFMNGAGSQLAGDIRTGQIATELMRPYNLLHKLMAMDLGGKTSDFIQSAVPLLVVAGLFFSITLPESLTAGILFVVSSILGILLAGVFDLIIGLLAFWTINTWGLRILRNAIVLFFSGSLIPISLFPPSMQLISQYLPFQSMVYVPVSIYTGAISGQDAWMAMGAQLFWIVFIYAVLRASWSQALRKVTIFGG
ncbi:ABC-2 family transporter protein [Paenibacillus sediminis]|uniref:ABC-2 type transport system permease protein n=1 Tax=Paenibacillus sediminis TaxID=664909 RepID=A0ABS4H4F8_9BACL|nr:ABC-2 family transporter protein [Paenibacillus sediminis]MBP1936985.1 ABC-2 type transport system permease protein [Paenibacillus sediminis]